MTGSADSGPREYTCPHCGDRFAARCVGGPQGNPPCLKCALEGKGPARFTIVGETQRQVDEALALGHRLTGTVQLSDSARERYREELAEMLTNSRIATVWHINSSAPRIINVTVGNDIMPLVVTNRTITPGDDGCEVVVDAEEVEYVEAVTSTGITIQVPRYLVDEAQS